MSKTGVFYGSSTGATQSAAETISKELNKNGIESAVHSIADVSVSQLASYTNIILGTSTWGMGDLQDDWEGVLGELKSADLKNKKIALFGLGDQDGYPDTFVDGIGILYDAVVAAGADVVGFVSTDGYSFDASLAERDGNFVGLPLDDDNQSDMTDERISSWIAVISEQFKG